MKRVATLGLALLACTSLPACHTAPTRPAVQLSKAVHWYRDSAEQRAAYLQAYRLAGNILEERLKSEPAGDWGVILDVDETVLDNSDFQKSEELLGKLKFDAKAWDAWVESRKATALPGAVEFTRLVHDELHGQVFLVTNRDAPACDATRSNLAAAGIPFNLVLCDTTGDGNKNPRFQQVQRGQGGKPVRILMWIGDNIGDFAEQSQGAWSGAKFGTEYFVLPNPMYGSWESRPAR